MLQRRLLVHRLIVIRAPKVLRSIHGRRFLELQSLLTEFLVQRLENDQELSKLAASQIINVLKHCDQITYEEPGTAEAYAMLHFLDRYHRFQLIFDSLHKNKLMPLRSDGVRILDIGTGPGPSMYAVSDFYTHALPIITNNGGTDERATFLIDYVERSQQFRDWLHHFTEFINSQSQTPWRVPFHKGTFSDFQKLEFDQKKTNWEYDEDGDRISVEYVKRHRFDLIIVSNFLTTKEQATAFSKEIENCARYLRNNGILLVVGARSSTQKYKDVYEEISKTITSVVYSNKNIIASCDQVKLTDSVMGYSWRDCYGERLKNFTKDIFEVLQAQAGDFIPTEASDLLRKSVHPEYSRAIEWQLLVFRKKARPRRKAPKPL